MKKYLTFKGLSSRSEYWGVTIITFIAFTISLLIGMVLFSTAEASGIIVGSLIILFSAVFYMWFFLAVAVKRCREAGINPWWTAACFLPYVGVVTWIVIGCLKPDHKE